MDAGELIGMILGSSTVSALLTLWGTKAAAKREAQWEADQAEVDNRRVGIEEFEAFKTAAYERMDRLEAELSNQTDKTTKVTTLLRKALAHIKLLHVDMLAGNLAPRRLPVELEAMLWAIETEDLPLAE